MSDLRLPAVLGGSPAFDETVPLARPSVPAIEEVSADLQLILTSKHLTNGPFVARLEEQAASRLGVRECIAVSSCTSGLMLLLRAAGTTGEVIAPSFTFAATVHAAAWNGNQPVFADVDAATLTLNPEKVAEQLTERTAAILATHIYGTPCDVESLSRVASSRGVDLFFDAAHAFGSSYQGKPIGGFGRGEVFSLTPTKPLVAGEGGIIATNDTDLAGRCRIGRDYGNPGDYDCRFIGLNARMSEVHAALALRSLETLDERLDRRNSISATYAALFRGIVGITLPQVRPGDRSTFKDFTILVNQEEFGLSAIQLTQALRSEGVETRRYYSPPVHKMRAYEHLELGRTDHLEVTDRAANQVVTLPLWEEMRDEDPVRIAEAIASIQIHAAEVASLLV